MTPGLALFYGGMVRRKNVLGTMMQSLILVALVSVQWALFGYSLAFHEGSFWGGFDWSLLQGVGVAPDPYGYASTIPHQVYMAFQLMFAIITPALITGAFAERMKFSAMILFMLLWATCVYDPLAHWVWGKGGWLASGIQVPCSAPSILPVAPWSTSAQGFPRWSLPWFWANASATEVNRLFRTI